MINPGMAQPVQQPQKLPLFRGEAVVKVGVDPRIESRLTPEARETFRRFKAFVNTYITPRMPFNQAGYSFGTSPDDESIYFTLYKLGPNGSGQVLGMGQVSRHEMENDPEETALRIRHSSRRSRNSLNRWEQPLASHLNKKGKGIREAIRELLEQFGLKTKDKARNSKQQKSLD